MNRFSEHDEIVLDSHSGLIWTKNASLNDFPMTWKEALAFIKKLNNSKLYGYSDWKLPSRRELFSLISHKTINPSLPPANPFVNVFTGYYWTSTSCARLPNQAWFVHLGGARVFKGTKDTSYMVWPVRIADMHNIKFFQTGQRNCYDENGNIINCQNTGQDAEFQSGLQSDLPRFVEDAICVYDTKTQLSWLKDANFKTKMLEWQAAIDLVEEMNQKSLYGYNDWRLPSILELESLIDMDRYSPALPIDNLFVNVQDFYWSATTSMYDTKYAWALYMNDGAVGVGYKLLPEFYLWPVRKGKS